MANEKHPEPVSFEMTPEDLAAVSEGKSKAVPNVQFFGKTAFTIENAPIPKSIRDAIGVEKTITVQMKVRLDRKEEK
ncbi:MAG: hypothetical protein ACOZNI_19905 [Myxococcota bacterium]